jgi:hypothetical protein
MINAAAYLYRLTGNTQYYNDAVLTAQFQLSQYPSIMSVDWSNNGPFGPDQFWRGLSNFARWNNLWSTYSTWLYNNADDAWDNRNTTYNICWDDIATQTPGPDILSMETLSAMVLRQVTTIQAMSDPPDFSGTYEIENEASGLALTISGGSNSNGAGVVQEAYTSGPHEFWTFVPTSGGYYHIINNASGLALNVSGNNTQAFQQGASIIQWTAQTIGGEDNDEWMPVLNSDGSYTFYNLNSEMVLDNPGGSTAAGTPYDQWVANGGTNQNFILISN